MNKTIKSTDARAISNGKFSRILIIYLSLLNQPNLIHFQM